MATEALTDSAMEQKPYRTRTVEQTFQIIRATRSLSNRTRLITRLKQESIARSTSKQRISLLDLPAEIWSKIGRYAVDNGPSLSATYFLYGEEWQWQPSIVQASRALREELLPYFLRTKVQPGGALNNSLVMFEFAKWLRVLDPEMRLCVRDVFTAVKAKHLVGGALDRHLKKL